MKNIDVKGNLRLQGGYWQMVTSWYDANGNRQRRSKTTGIPEGVKPREKKRNQEEANRMLDDHIKNTKEKLLAPEQRRINYAIDDWLMRKKNAIRLNTWEAYVSYAEGHIKPYFEAINPFLKDITVRDMQNYLEYEIADREKPVSVNSVKRYFAVLNGVFDEAVLFGEIDRNPCDKVKFPNVKKYQPKPYTVEQTKKLLQGFDGEAVKPAIMLAVYLGLRHEEIAGLRWCNVDFVNNQINIFETRTKFKTEIIEEHTKSGASRRVIPMPEDLKVYLLELQEAQEKNRLKYGNGYTDSGYVCQWDNGAMLSYDYIGKRYKKVVKKLGLPENRLHDLRHTAVSLLVSSGVDVKTASKFVGHSSTRFTLDVYDSLITTQALLDASTAMNTALAEVAKN